jgi:hypothetical protein
MNYEDYAQKSKKCFIDRDVTCDCDCPLWVFTGIDHNDPESHGMCSFKMIALDTGRDYDKE